MLSVIPQCECELERVSLWKCPVLFWPLVCSMFYLNYLRWKFVKNQKQGQFRKAGVQRISKLSLLLTFDFGQSFKRDNSDRTHKGSTKRDIFEDSPFNTHSVGERIFEYLSIIDILSRISFRWCISFPSSYCKVILLILLYCLAVNINIAITLSFIPFLQYFHVLNDMEVDFPQGYKL